MVSFASTDADRAVQGEERPGSGEDFVHEVDFLSDFDHYAGIRSFMHGDDGGFRIRSPALHFRMKLPEAPYLRVHLGPHRLQFEEKVDSPGVEPPVEF